MKRLLLLSVLLMPFLVLLSPIVSADENKVCFILLADYSEKTLSEKLKQQNCKSDNVLVAKFLMNNPTRKIMLIHSASFCRYDRIRDIEGDTLTCVLNSTKPRALQEMG